MREESRKFTRSPLPAQADMSPVSTLPPETASATTVPPAAEIQAIPIVPTPDMYPDVAAQAEAADQYFAARRRRNIGRGLTALALSVATVAAVSAVPSAHTNAHDNGRSVYQMFPDRPLPVKPTAAATPDAASLQAVNNLLNQPTDPDILNPNPLMDAYIQSHPDTAPSAVSSRVQAAIRARIAKQSGTTVFDPTDTDTVLRDNMIPKQSSMNLDAYIATANGFLANYDISISDDRTPLAKNHKDSGTTTPLTDSFNTRKIIDGLVRETAKEPKEYTDLVAAKEYLLVDNAGPAAAYAARGYKGPEGPAIVIATDSVSDAAVIFHEQAHGADYQKSGQAMATDPTVEALSANAPYGKAGEMPAPGQPDRRRLLAEDMGWLTLDDYNDARETIIENTSPHFGKADCAAVARTGDEQIKLAGSRTVLTSTYAGTSNVVERKAEIERYFPQGNSYPQVLSPNLPHIATEFKSRLAVLYMFRPRVARFFIQMAVHSDIYGTPRQDDSNYLQQKCTFYDAHPDLLSAPNK